MSENYFLVFRSKKNNDFGYSENVIRNFAKRGYYFDKLSYVAFDNSAEIVSALKDGLANYENLVILCPEIMDKTLKSFISGSLGASFGENNTLKCGRSAVYILYTGNDNANAVEDICSEFDKVYGGYEKAFVKTVGMRATEINEAVAAARSACNCISINVTEKFGDCTLEIIYGNTVSKTQFDKAYRELVSRLSEGIYALTDETLEQRLVDLLKLRRMKISVAESFTGGGISKRLVGISGVSQVYFEGLNTYDNKSKQQRLSVEEETLSRYGAVSKETAKQMAQGLLKNGNCNIAVATTGIAGPKSDESRKPVGLVYIAIGVDNEVKVYEYNLKGSRHCITETAINLALFLAFKTLK